MDQANLEFFKKDTSLSSAQLSSPNYVFLCNDRKKLLRDSEEAASQIEVDGDSQPTLSWYEARGYHREVTITTDTFSEFPIFRKSAKAGCVLREFILKGRLKFVQDVEIVQDLGFEAGDDVDVWNGGLKDIREIWISLFLDRTTGHVDRTSWGP